MEDLKMKIRIGIVLLITILTGITSCDLDTLPTNKVGNGQMFENVDGAFAALNGIYRGFYTTQWSSYETENFGPAAVNIVADIMGEDFVEREQGSGWFWFDYRYWVREEINNKGDRPYAFWNMFYQYVNNANNILANIDNAEGDQQKKENIKAQALTIRAFSYFNLIRFYQRTFIGHENDPGVPLYLTPTNSKTEGKGRGTVEDVYNQINTDLNEAIQLFTSAGLVQEHKSHADVYVAYGLKSRVALVQEKWNIAAESASKAKEKPGLTLMDSKALLDGFNSVANSEWMWGSEIIDSQATGWYSFFNHMDANAEGHAESARKLSSNWLYAMIDDNDIRKQWFMAPTGLLVQEEEKLGPNVSYNQIKFRVKAKGSWASDYLYMRGSEMYLNEAEAQCQLGNYAEARRLLKNICDIRYANGSYDSRLSKVTDSKELTLKSSESREVKTLMDEIILQRRFELWGEGFRIFDIMRLKTGFTRNYPDMETNHPIVIEQNDPESWDWILMIPMTEFDGNQSLDYDRDQNP